MKYKFMINIGSLLLAFSPCLFAVSGMHGAISIGTQGSNDEICVYCHTPHAARVTGATPLWNKPTTALELTNGFTMYGASSTNTAGTTVAGTPTEQQPLGPSLACLTCHDGASATNSVINAPGSGNTDPVNGILIGQDSEGKILYPLQVLSVGLDGDLTDDHPLSIEYIEGRASLRPITDATDFYGATFISDLLRDGRVECVSCHDPHGTAGIPRYLRKSNNDSALCFGCHDK